MSKKISQFFKSLSSIPWIARVLAFMAIMGPGLITANVDNDANGIATYSVAGADFGYAMIWVLALVVFFQAIVQEMCARLGCITGKGLSDLIRENYGVRSTMYLMIVLFFANFANVIGDFAGLAAGAELFGVPKYIAVPAGALIVWFLVLKGTYERVEKVFLWACLIYLTYIASGILARPDWAQVARQSISIPKFNFAYIYMVTAIVGTTIAPWMQFFQQAAVRDKQVPIKDYSYVRWDTYIGTFTMSVVSFFIIIACAATLNLKGIKIETADQAAQALRPLAGNNASLLFAAGLINAALFSISIIPLSTSYAICEAFGWESGIGKSFKEAPVFLGIYTLLLAAGAFIILMPGIPLIQIMILSQALNGILLPVILIFIIQLINKKKLMGKYSNSPTFNFLAYVTVIVLGLISIALIIMTIISMLK